MAKLSSKWNDHHSYIWRCDCHDWHYIQIEWDDEDSQWRILEFADTYHPLRWRDRIVAAIKMLRGKPHFHSGIVLTESDVDDIVKVLTKHSGTKPEPAQTRKDTPS